MNGLVKYSTDNGIAIVTIDNPPVNALSPGVPEGIVECIKRAEADSSILAIVLIGGGRTFIAGADIREFGKITSGEKTRDIGLAPALLEIENCSKAVVCAIHGTALGGGLETAMACHYRVAVPQAKVGQPEVKLGIIPGAAGTQRLPRLAGIPKALEMCTVGDPINAPDALACGIVDRIVEDGLLAGAIAFAREHTAPLKTRERNQKLTADAAVFAAARAEVRKKQRGLMAPLAAIDAIEASLSMGFEEACAKEAEIFKQCLFSDQSKALIHAFFGERAVNKIPGIAKNTPVREIAKAAIAGAGTMGGGIAMAYVNAGIPVILKETTQDALDRGMATIRKNYAASVERGRFTRQVADQRLAMITPTLSYDGFGDADIAVEAVFEGMDLKKKVFTELDHVTSPGAILASNTSTLDIDQIASVTSQPQRVIGTHFFSPANVMKLVEVVRGKATSPEVIATAMALARKLGKVGVLVGNCHGFVGNRMVAPYLREAQFLVEEGASPREVDAALYGFGMAMGPIAMHDLAGLDVGWRIRQELAREGKLHTDLRQPLVEDRLCVMGRYGQKTGAGWYRYEAGSRAPIPDPEVDEIIASSASTAGIARRAVGAEEIIERTTYALANEGARILEEGFALRAVDIDIIYIFGYGFPAHRGGPMWHASAAGLRKVYDRVCEFERLHGEHWRPAPLLRELAESGKTFEDWDRARGAE